MSGQSLSGRFLGSQYRTGSDSPRKDWLFASFLLAAIVAALGTEFVQDRYGSPSFATQIPGGSTASAASRAAEYLTYALAVLLLLRELAAPATAIGTPVKRMPSGLIWLPYIFAWIAVALLHYEDGMETYVYLSLVTVATIALVSFRRSVEWAASVGVIVMRGTVVASLILGWFYHSRAFAPYSVWPGGWWEGADRLQGIFPHPNTLGWMAAVCLGQLLINWKRERLITILGVGSAAFAALWQSGSRTASVALAVCILTYLVGSIRRRSKLSRIVANLTLLAGVFAMIFLAYVENFGPDSFNGRSIAWDFALKTFQQNPFFGLGPEAYAMSESPGGGYAHNQVLQAAAELGSFGLAALTLHVLGLVRLVKANATVEIASLVAMWFATFLSENLLRFAAPGFGLQIVFFQLVLLAQAKPSGGSPVVAFNGFRVEGAVRQ